MEDAIKKVSVKQMQKWIEMIAPCMDDYLYIIDLQKNTFKISQAAVDRFMMSGTSEDSQR